MARPHIEIAERPVTHRAAPAPLAPAARQLTRREQLLLTLLGAIGTLAGMALIFGAVWWVIP